MTPGIGWSTVKDSGNNVLESFAYDGVNRRVSTTAGSTTTDLYYSAEWQVLEEQVGGNTTMQYVWSPVYIDAMILRDRDTDANGSLDERLWVQQDANFNVTAIVNGSGSVVERYAYDPFGSATVYDSSWGSRSSTSYGWAYLQAGLRFDQTAVAYDNRERWYDCDLGRFLSADPLQFKAGDINFYRYVANSPVNRSDPIGLKCHVCAVKAYYRESIKSMDSLVKGQPFKDLAEAARKRINGEYGQFGINYATEFPTAGVYTRLSQAAGNYPAGTFKHGGFLFFVTFDVCGDCKLFLDETGTKDVVTLPNGQSQVVLEGQNEGDITNGKDVRIADLAKKNGDCDKKIIYADFPSGLASLKKVADTDLFGFLNTVKQKIEVRDAATNATVGKWTHTILIGVDYRGKVTGEQCF